MPLNKETKPNLDWSMSWFIRSLVNWRYTVSLGVLKIIWAELLLVDWSAGCRVSIVNWLISVGCCLVGQECLWTGTMICSRKHKSFYYACSNKDSLYVVVMQSGKWLDQQRQLQRSCRNSCEQECDWRAAGLALGWSIIDGQ